MHGGVERLREGVERMGTDSYLIVPFLKDGYYPSDRGKRSDGCYKNIKSEDALTFSLKILYRKALIGASFE